jgi:hypothetical protein
VSEKKSRFSRGSPETIPSEQLEAIVQAAEHAAAQVIDEAEEQALRFLVDARAEADVAYQQRISSLSGATDSLIAQAAEIRRRSDRLLEALEEVRAILEEETAKGHHNRRATDPPATDRPAPRASHLSAVAPFPQPEAARPQSHPVRESPAGARLVATQMAISGSTREEIAARLRNGFDIEDTDAILDAILGPEE